MGPTCRACYSPRWPLWSSSSPAAPRPCGSSHRVVASSSSCEIPTSAGAMPPRHRRPAQRRRPPLASSIQAQATRWLLRGSAPRREIKHRKRGSSLVAWNRRAIAVSRRGRGARPSPEGMSRPREAAPFGLSSSWERYRSRGRGKWLGLPRRVTVRLRPVSKNEMKFEIQRPAEVRYFASPSTTSSRQQPSVSGTGTPSTRWPHHSTVLQGCHGCQPYHLSS